MGGGGGKNRETVVQQQQLDPNLTPYIYGSRGYLPQAYSLSQRPHPYYPGHTVAPFNTWQTQGIQNVVGAGNQARELATSAQPAVTQLLGGLNSEMVQRARMAGIPAIQSLSELSRTGYAGSPIQMPQIRAAQIAGTQIAPFDPARAEAAEAARIGFLNFANPNPTIGEFMMGTTGGLRNPYLDEMVMAAQESGRRGFEDLSDVSTRAFQYNILPQIREAQGLIPQAVRSFQEEVLPSIRQDYLSGGAFGGSRQGLAEGLAASRFGENLIDEMGNLAEITTLTGGQTYQDLLRNQARAGTDLGNIAAGMYGGAFSEAQQRALQAAGLGAGLQQTAQGALVSQGGLQNAANLLNAQLGTDVALRNMLTQSAQNIRQAELDNLRNIRQAELTTGVNTAQAQLQGTLANAAQQRALAAAQSGLGNYLQAGQLGTQQVGAGLSGLGTINDLYSQLGTAQLGVGALQQAQQQAQLQAAIDRYNYNFQEPRNRAQWYASMVNPLIAGGGINQATTTGSGTDVNPWTAALGGSMVGASIPGLGPWGALAGGGLGLLGGYLW